MTPTQILMLLRRFPTDLSAREKTRRILKQLASPPAPRPTSGNA